jgi:hypothetical protein
MLVSMFAAGCTAAAALAAPPDDARAATERFLAALAAEDGNTVCGMLTARTLALVGGAQKCVSSFSSDEPDENVEVSPSATGTRDVQRFEDEFEKNVLYEVFDDARALGLARGGYVTNEAPLTRLVRELRALEPRLKFSIGTRPSAARGKDSFHVVVDRQTRGRTIVLYAESDSGAILRLRAQGFKNAAVAKAGRGIPAKAKRHPAPRPRPQPAEPEEPPTFSITGVTLLDDVSAQAAVDAIYEGHTLPFLVALKLEGGAWKVDELFFGIFSVFGILEPKPAG